MQDNPPCASSWSSRDMQTHLAPAQAGSAPLRAAFRGRRASLSMFVPACVNVVNATLSSRCHLDCQLVNLSTRPNAPVVKLTRFIAVILTHTQGQTDTVKLTNAILTLRQYTLICRVDTHTVKLTACRLDVPSTGQLDRVRS